MYFGGGSGTDTKKNNDNNNKTQVLKENVCREIRGWTWTVAKPRNLRHSNLELSSQDFGFFCY